MNERLACFVLVYFVFVMCGTAIDSLDRLRKNKDDLELKQQPEGGKQNAPPNEVIEDLQNALEKLYDLTQKQNVKINKIEATLMEQRQLSKGKSLFG